MQRIEEALALIHQETERAQAQMNFLMRHVADAVLSGTLLGKLTRARELGVALEIDEQSSLSCPLTATGQEVMMSVVGNLLDNACHAALNGPHASEPKVRLFFTDLGEQLLVEVEDNGAGSLRSTPGRSSRRAFRPRPASTAALAWRWWSGCVASTVARSPWKRASWGAPVSLPCWTARYVPAAMNPAHQAKRFTLIITTLTRG